MLEHDQSVQIPRRETVGLIGLGLMGTALADRLLRHGFGVLGFDLDPARCAVLRELGGNTGRNAVEVIGQCGRVILSLPDLDVVTRVLAEIGPALHRGQVLIDTTTGSPHQAVQLAVTLAGAGVTYLDATVSGSSAQVREGGVILMVGGPKEPFAACADLFQCVSRRAFHVGPSGSGAKMKLASNLVLGLNRAALAEGLALAGALGLDLEQTLNVFRESAAYSRIMDTKGEKMITGNFEPQARLSQHLKDLRLILEAGDRARLPLPLSRAHRELLETAEGAGLGDLDNSAVIRAYEARSSSAQR